MIPPKWYFGGDPVKVSISIFGRTPPVQPPPRLRLASELEFEQVERVE